MGVEPSLEQKFANLSIPVKGLRAHFDKNDGKILLSKEMAEVGKDLEAALAAAFETIFTKTGGRLPPCPNQELEDLSTPIKPLRDFGFEKHPLGIAALFATTEIQRKEELTSQLTKALQQAREDDDLDSLAGREVLGVASYSCGDTQLLESFWQTALASAWIRGLPTIPVVRLNPAVADALAEQPEFHTPSMSAQPGMPTYQWPVPPVAPVAKEESNTVKFGTDLSSGLLDFSLAGGGLYFQRGVVVEYQMTFIPQVVNEMLRDVELAAVKVIAKITGIPDEQMAPHEFREKYSKFFVKGRKEAKAVWHADKKLGHELPTSIIRTAVKRGFIRGEYNKRRFLGWAGILLGLGDASFRLFRDDKKGLDGPLTDLGLDPSFARVAMAGLNTLTIGAMVLTSGFSSPLGIVMLGLAVAELAAPDQEA